MIYGVISKIGELAILNKFEKLEGFFLQKNC